VAFALVALTAFAFWPVLGNGFVNLDDETYVTRNPWVQRGLTAESLRWAWTTGYAANWHPLTWMSHMLDEELWGGEPRGHHLTSLVLHAVNALLLFWVLERMTGDRGRSSVVAALFAVHPLHVESVAWVAERKDVLSTTFWMLALLAYAGYVRRGGTLRYLVVAALLALGLAAKPMLVTLPIVLLLLDPWPLRRECPHFWEKVPLLGIAAASAVATFLVQRAGEAVRTTEQYPLAARLANAVVTYATYLAKTVWPVDLAVFYPHRGSDLPVWQVAASLALLAISTAFVVWQRDRRPWLFTGWLWYVVTCLPVIGIVQVGGQAMADRYTYVPLVGVFMMLAWSVPDRVTTRFRGGARAVLPATAAAVILVLALLTRAQAARWRDSETLFRHALRVSEGNAKAHNHLGASLAEQGRLDEAIAEYEEALRLSPRYDEAHNNLGVALAAAGRHAEAVPHYVEVLERRPDQARVRVNLGNALQNLGRLDEAESQFTHALRVDPAAVDAHYNLALTLSRAGRTVEAIGHYERALEIDPRHAAAHNNLGNALARQGRLTEAIEHFEHALRIDPRYATAHANLAAARLAEGRYEEAWRAVREARRLGFEPPRALVEDLSARMPEPLQGR
jgi:Flp pilus assembly protein TadD